MTTNPFQNYPPGIVTAQIMGKMLNFLSESRYRDLQAPTSAVVIAELFVYVKNKIMALNLSMLSTTKFKKKRTNEVQTLWILYLKN